MKPLTLLVITALVACVVTAPAGAQTAPPFYTASATAYDPVIGVIQTGILLQPQSWVSPDRKYVNMSFQATQSTATAMQSFPVVQQTARLGFVGGANFTRPKTAAAVARARPSKAQPAAPASAILTQQGMFRLTPG